MWGALCTVSWFTSVSWGNIRAALPISKAHVRAGNRGSLSISKGSVSTGTRQLLALGFIRKVWVQSERKDHFEAVLELGDMLRSAYDRIFKVRAQNAERRLDAVQTLWNLAGKR